MKLLTEWAVTSSILILIVVAVRQLFKNRLSARLKYALWGVVLLRLLVPFQIELPAAASDTLPVLASNLAPEVADMELYALRTNSRPLLEDSLADMRENGIDTGSVIGTTAMIYQIGDLEWEGGQRCIVLSETSIDTYFFYTTLPKFLMTLWVIGAICAAWMIFSSNRHFLTRLKYYRHPLEGTEAPIPVYRAANVSSPCLFGVFRPAVYLTPAAAENPDTLRHVLAHELTHYRHRDHLWSLLRCLALALHWYNPLVWLAVILSKEDSELACDEGAVACLGEEERIPYGRTLVDMVAARSMRPTDLLSCSTAMTGGRKSIQQRVAQIVKRPETVKTALFAVIAVVALSAVFVFAGRGQPGKENKMLSDYLDRTTAIRYSPPAYSSQIYPVPIADQDLLNAAKEVLNSATSLGPDDPEPDRGTLIHASVITLMLEDGEEIFYTLLYQDGCTYILEGAVQPWYEDSGQSPWYSAAYRCEGDAASVLESLARQQRRGTEKTMITPSVTPELEEFFTQLEAAQSIYVDQLMLSSANPPGLIDHPEALARAKELLGKARAPFQLGKDITEEELLNIRRSLISAVDTEPVHITPEELKTMLFTRGNPILLCPGPEVTPDLEFRYWLADQTLLLWNGELEENPKVLATFSEDVYAQLAELAQKQGNTAPDAFDHNRYNAQLEGARGIWMNMPTLHDGRVLTDPDQLKRVKELLRINVVFLGVATLEGEESQEPGLSAMWDGEWTHILSFASSYPEPSWTGGPDYYYLKALNAGDYQVCAGEQGGHVLGSISAESWAEAEKILRGAPSVDERQRTLSHAAFLDRVEGAVSIQVESGDGEKLPPITEPEWLETARAALMSLTPVPDDVNTLASSSEDQLRRNVGSGSYAVTLTDKAGGTATYYVNRRPMTNVDYLVCPTAEYPVQDCQTAVSFCRVGVLPGEAGYTLWVSAKAAYGEIEPPTGNAKPDLS